MKKVIWPIVIATMLAIIASLCGLAVPANATDTSPPLTCTGVDMNHGEGNCGDVIKNESNSAAEASVNDTATSVNGVDIHSSVTVVAFVQAKGATKSQMHGKKLRLKHGKTLKTSWRVNRGYGWHMKYYPKGYTFVKGKDGFWHDPKCYNSVVGLPKGKTKLPYREIKGAIKVVKSFSFSVTSKVAISDKVKAEAAAWANAFDSNGRNTCHAYGYGQGTGEFAAAASAKASGSVLSKVQATARGNAKKLVLRGKSLVDIHASTIASAMGSASAKASAKASCSTYLPPPAKRTCKDTYGPGYSGDYPNCHKDGTTTPPPPANAPGPNPPPSGGTGDPGSNKCYSEETGQPVAANPNGSCPAGSFGG